MKTRITLVFEVEHDTASADFNHAVGAMWDHSTLNEVIADALQSDTPKIIVLKTKPADRGLCHPNLELRDLTAEERSQIVDKATSQLDEDMRQDSGYLSDHLVHFVGDQTIAAQLDLIATDPALHAEALGFDPWKR